MKASFKKYTLQFRQPSGTSRGVYTTRDSWFIFITDGLATGIGECAPLPDLSIDGIPRMNTKLLHVCEQIDYFVQAPEELREWPAIQFAIETAMLDLKNGGKRLLFPGDFTEGRKGIPINGLIWMGKPDFMKQQIQSKIEAGFRCIKMKIGALDFDTEFEILKSVRKEFSPDDITLRVDANCAYTYQQALENLKRLSDLNIHSIEQPIATGRWNEMAQLCKQSPVPVALDEELIGISSGKEMEKLIRTIGPAYLILKPSLHGGIAGCYRWIELAKETNTSWWVTSALESNIGLNAIAQWTAQLDTNTEQGLGTGQLFTNNFDSPLEISGEKLWHIPEKNWELSYLTMNEDNNEDDF